MKKMISKGTALLTVAALVTSVSATSAGLGNFVRDTGKLPAFTDVPAGAWYEESVKMVNQYGLMEGNSESSFNPLGEISLAEVIVLAARLHSIYNEKVITISNQDVWYQSYLDYATEQNIIGVDLFGNYMASATRAQFAMIIANALPEEGYQNINNLEAGDLFDVPEYGSYVNGVYQLYNAGILTGSDPVGRFNAGATITRSEVATILTRVADSESRVKLELMSANEYVDVVKERYLDVSDAVLEGVSGIIGWFESVIKALETVEDLDGFLAQEHNERMVIANELVAELHALEQAYVEFGYYAELINFKTVEAELVEFKKNVNQCKVDLSVLEAGVGTIGAMSYIEAIINFSETVSACMGLKTHGIERIV